MHDTRPIHTCIHTYIHRQGVERVDMHVYLYICRHTSICTCMHAYVHAVRHHENVAHMPSYYCMQARKAV